MKAAFYLGSFDPISWISSKAFSLSLTKNYFLKLLQNFPKSLKNFALLFPM